MGSVPRVLLESEVLSAASYDQGAGALTIEFRHGGVYRYYLVPRRVFDGLLAAPSAGHYFTTEIRGAYTYEQVRGT